MNINLSSGEPKLVIDGRIETDGYPFVVLTRSVGYFSRIDLTTLENTFVHNAVVTVSDGSKTIQLKEYSIDTGLVGTKFSFYSIDTGDATSFNFKGKAETYYTLKIEAEGKTYNSITKIPTVGGIDSLWFRKPSENMNVPTAVMMYVRYSDPDTLGNYVRYFTKRNSEMFLVPFNSTFDDQIVNGTTIDSLSLVAGYNRSQEQPNFDSVGYFFRGDTVTLKWCSIDKPTFKFFSTFEFATGSVGNPFSSPVNVTSNIQGGALGVWAGYGVQLTTRIISK
ncbi:MAG TPA: DUF4249 family protein [Flavipsychrobacter sp.]|nr:DUF4249 family protein [Flavipsychrobacter sp.]